MYLIHPHYFIYQFIIILLYSFVITLFLLIPIVFMITIQLPYSLINEQNYQMHLNNPILIDFDDDFDNMNLL